MNHADDEFRLKGRPSRRGRSRDDARFLTRVLTAVSRAELVSGLTSARRGRKGEATLHRDTVAFRLARVQLDGRSRRVIVKLCQAV